MLRSFYDFHRDCGTGPVLNPFPLDSSRRGRRHAHHNPMDERTPEKAGRYRPVVPRRRLDSRTLTNPSTSSVTGSL